MEGRIAKPQSSCRVPSPCIPSPCRPTPCLLLLLTLFTLSLHYAALHFTLPLPAHPTFHPPSSPCSLLTLLTLHPVHFHLASLSPASFHHSFVWPYLFNPSSFPLPSFAYISSPCLILPCPATPNSPCTRGYSLFLVVWPLLSLTLSSPVPPSSSLLP